MLLSSFVLMLDGGEGCSASYLGARAFLGTGLSCIRLIASRFLLSMTNDMGVDTHAMVYS